MTIKTQFNSNEFYTAILVIIGGLLVWNIYATVISRQLIGVLPITIQTVLIWLIWTKHHYAKIGIKVWSVVFLIIAAALQFAGRLLQDLVTGFEEADAVPYINAGFSILFGALIYVYANKTVEVIVIGKEQDQLTEGFEEDKGEG